MKESYNTNIEDNNNEEVTINNVNINNQTEAVNNEATNNQQETVINSMETNIDNLESKLEIKHNRFALFLGIILVILSIIDLLWGIKSTMMALESYQSGSYIDSLVGPIELLVDLTLIGFSIPFSIGTIVALWGGYYIMLKFHNYFIRLNKKKKIKTVLTIIAVIICLVALFFIRIFWYSFW